MCQPSGVAVLHGVLHHEPKDERHGVLNTQSLAVDTGYSPQGTCPFRSLVENAFHRVLRESVKLGQLGNRPGLRAEFLISLGVFRFHTSYQSGLQTTNSVEDPSEIAN